MNDQQYTPRRTGRNSIKSAEEILAETDLPEKEKNMIAKAYETEMTTINDELKNAYVKLDAQKATMADYDKKMTDAQDEITTLKNEKDEQEQEISDLRKTIHEERDEKAELECENASLEKVKEELLLITREEVPVGGENKENQAKIMVIVDKMMDSNKMEMSATVDWQCPNDITDIQQLITALQSKQTSKIFMKVDKIVLLLGITEVMTTRGGRDMAELTGKYLDAIKALSKLNQVCVIEIPMVKPDGNYSGAVLFNMDIAKGVKENEIEYITTEKEAKEANKMKDEKIWKNSTELNEKGLRLFADIISRDVIIPEPRVHVESGDDTDEDEMYVPIPTGFTGFILQDKGKRMKKICQSRKIKVTLGTWKERKQRFEKEGAIIKGPRSERKALKRRIIDEVKMFKRSDFQRSDFPAK